MIIIIVLMINIIIGIASTVWQCLPETCCQIGGISANIELESDHQLSLLIGFQEG